MAEAVWRGLRQIEIQEPRSVWRRGNGCHDRNAIDLGHLQANGWATVYEVGGRRFDIAEQNECAMVDLHFFEDGACCLSLKYAPEKDLALQRFMLELVIPLRKWSKIPEMPLGRSSGG